MPWEVTISDNKRFDNQDSWTHVMNYCNAKKVHIWRMKLYLDKTALWLPENAEGYWVATAMNAMLSGPRASKYGAGFVQGRLVKITWLFYDHYGHVSREPEVRDITNEHQIIWRLDRRQPSLLL